MTSWPCDERWVDNLWGTLLSQRPPFWLRRHQVSPRLNFRYRPQIQAPLRDQVQWLENISDDGAYWRYVYISMLLQYRCTLPKIFKILNVKIYKRTGDLYLFLHHAVNRNAVFFLNLIEMPNFLTQQVGTSFPFWGKLVVEFKLKYCFIQVVTLLKYLQRWIKVWSLKLKLYPGNDAMIIRQLIFCIECINHIWTLNKRWIFISKSFIF